ncbi:hypothetical protein J7E38_09680 [Bacillus sp. ISL-35]|uniref:hypothetical protein n=1 Tax=Bacillus sp. ISL-35 TaxID=2819122 RepID=UPI001BEC1B08|nr:hypothetical protein [Bacillus sp. ISL-35]MBT2679273.1 hypothetical protein [Bacillus sp. ISL-35]MBT2703169.1 hypothetical protein [Chryseobacterium sp. ISL-80]
MRVSNATFKSSVNIKFDIGNKDYFKRYLPTPSHAESILGLLKGFNQAKGNHSHIIIGPYGTGKSLLGTIVGGIVSGNIDDKTFELLLNKFNNVDDEIFKELSLVKGLKKKYLPVILNGYEGKFRHALLSSIMSTLSSNGINITIPGKIGKIIDIIYTWENDYPKTYKQFLNLIKQREFDIDSWRMEILTHNKNEMEWFSEVFPSLTSGAFFSVDYHEDFIEQVKYILNELETMGIGIFIIYDEFGRFLQNLEVHEIHETMQDLQDLAELSDHKTSDLTLLLITHKNLRQYFLKFNDDYKSEFQRIEKRFKQYHIESDKATFIRLTDSLLNTKTKSLNEQETKQLKNDLRKYPLFPELNQVEIENIILKGIYPIHPVSLYLLPILSNLFGQNERTLFTFLESSDHGGLIQHINISKGYYYPYQLFDYFISDLENSQESKHLALYKKIVNKTPEINNEANKEKINLLKFMTLWNLSGLQSNFKLTNEFISFAFNKPEEDVKELLKSLEILKAIRYNRSLGYWEIFEGSSFEIDNLLSDYLEKSNISRLKKISVMESALLKKFYLANDYNDKKSLTRFASVNLVFSSDILNDVFNSVEVRKQKQSDAVLNYVILESTNHYEKVIRKIKTLNDPHSLFCVTSYTFELIEKQVIDYNITKVMLSDTELLKKDKDLKAEILLKMDDLLFEISEFMKVYENFDSSLVWILNSTETNIGNEIVMGRKLSDLMFELYPDTPEIRNDSFNRRHINTVQLKASFKVINHIINYNKYENINIEGHGPDYLIYATVFKNNNLKLDQLSNISNPFYRKMRERLIAHIEMNHSGDLKDLVEILSEKPFGVRSPLIPVLLVSLIRDVWDDLMFYGKGMFVDNIDGEILSSMINEPEHYQYVYFQLDAKVNGLLSYIEHTFSTFYKDQNNKPKIISANEAMLKWLRALPRFTQTTLLMDEKDITLKEIIKLGEVDPRKAIENLYNTYAHSIEEISESVLALNNFINYQSKEIENKVLNLVGCDNFETLFSWAQKSPVFQQKENKLISSILSINNTDNWIKELVYNMIGIEIENWSDKTKEMVDAQLINEYNKSLGTESLSDNPIVPLTVGSKTKAIEKVELTTKSKTIYRNLHGILDRGGRNLSQDEIEHIVLRLVEDFVLN